MTTNPTARDIHRHDQQTAEQNAVLDQMVKTVAANLAEGIEPGELAVIAAQTLLADPGRACTMAGFALVRLAQTSTELDTNERSEDARLAIAEAELEKVRAQLADTHNRAHTDATNLQQILRDKTALANERDALKQQIAEADVVIASLLAAIDEADKSEVAR